jgi:hypothetical protein
MDAPTGMLDLNKSSPCGLDKSDLNLAFDLKTNDIFYFGKKEM